MDKLDSNPNPKESYHPSILAAMKFARKKLNHYYSLTDLSAVYRIAMGKFKHFIYILNTHSMTVLHPALKLEYFRQHEWEEDWIDTALQLVQDEYTARYEKALPAEESPVATKPTPTNDFAGCQGPSSLVVQQTAHLSKFVLNGSGLSQHPPYLYSRRARVFARPWFAPIHSKPPFA